MWLTPNSSRTARTASARSCCMRPRLAAPKRGRVLRCPVRPNSICSIMSRMLEGGEMVKPEISVVPLATGGRDLDEVAVVAARAFQYDPFFAFLEPGQVRRARGLALF